MSFGLLTAINVDDVPKILRRCASGWRHAVTKRYPHAWQMVADEVDRFADELADKIAAAKKAEPRRRRVVLDENEVRT